MAMESCGDVNGGADSHCDAFVNGLVHNDDMENGSEELDVDLVNEFDSYFDGIADHLTVSRMVSDSVIRGIVNAVEQDAADRIAQKELELVRLKKMMNPYYFSSDENKSSIKCHEPDVKKGDAFSRLSDALHEHDKIQESLWSLQNSAKGQFKDLKIEIEKIRGHNSIKRINPGSECVGAACILQEDETRKWIGVGKTLDSLRITLETVYEQVEHIIYSSKTSLCQWQLEREYQDEVEHMVVTNCFRSLKEQFEERLWDQNAQCHGIENVNWNEKINAISNLRQELDAISKLLSIPESGMPNSHSSLEINGDLSNNRRADNLQRKASGSLWDGNGKHEESVISVPENLDPAQLMHMSKEELVNYFKLEMTKMKRNHDYKIHEMTDEYFSLKRDYLKLKERGSSLPSKKDKEFDVLRKKIPDIMVKLDSILVENEKLTISSNNGETLGSLKDRLESLVSENHQLRDSLSDKRKEVNRLSSQVSDAIVKMSQQSLTENNLLKRVENLESAVEDANIEAKITGDVYKCFIREKISQIKQISEDSELEQNIWKEIYDLIFRDAFYNMSHLSKGESEDFDLESLIMEELCGIVFREAFSEAREKLHDLSKDAFEKERLLKWEVAEKEKLHQEMLALESVIDEKENLLGETEAALAREKEKLISTSRELDIVRDQATQQQMTISKCNEESSNLKSNLHQALEKLELNKVETCELNQKLIKSMNDLRESDDEKRRLFVAVKEKENALSSMEENENEHRKQMESIIILVEGLSKAVAGFECRVAEHMERSNLRLEYLCSQSSSLRQMLNVLKGEGLQYKQNLKRMSSDLEKAETEVDLLGDEVEVLLGLLEKIYIALDHYSPILKHYPGIMEILKLVRRELSGESTR
ncbi:hypothetical protein CCACVL1_11482 [Corchorus capsularis]|uniref:WPP domain-associated protein n=1 Tax=Corchorus capsularis TaxID=210143 RepID=A0A1R3IKZ0_COCAP|nr:hypothetical protein CCACVL1_11482 [Corchorus capsularis]